MEENMKPIQQDNVTSKPKLIDIDKKTGKMKLSRKVLFPKPERMEGEDRGHKFDKPFKPRE